MPNSVKSSKIPPCKPHFYSHCVPPPWLIPPCEIIFKPPNNSTVKFPQKQCCKLHKIPFCVPFFEHPCTTLCIPHYCEHHCKLSTKSPTEAGLESSSKKLPTKIAAKTLSKTPAKPLAKPMIKQPTKKPTKQPAKQPEKPSLIPHAKHIDKSSVNRPTKPSATSSAKPLAKLQNIGHLEKYFSRK